MKPINEIVKVVQLKIKDTPLDIKLLFVFSFLMTIASSYIHLESNKDLYKKIIPYTGWSPGREYMSLLLFIPLYILTIKDPKKTNIIVRSLCLVFLGLSLFSGVADYNLIVPEDYTSSNPYLRYDSLTPIFTIALPLFWIIIISSALLISFLKNNQKSIS